jgi:membrane protease YdiL (CAAX protease family)
MRNLLQKMPWPVEFAVVVAGAFGLAIIDSFNSLHHPAVHTAPDLWRSVALDATVLLILGGLLYLRGWNLTRLGLQSDWIDGLHGLGLAAVCYFVVAYGAYLVLAAFLPDLAAAAAKVHVVPHGLSPWLIAALVIVDALYEEVFATGYVITVLKEKTTENIAVNVSVALRLSYHIGLGVTGVLSAIPIGLIFGYWFARTDKLWPVIVAHAAINLVGFLAT